MKMAHKMVDDRALRLQIPGMLCEQNCVRTVKQVLQRVLNDTNARIDVDLLRKLATISNVVVSPSMLIGRLWSLNVT